MRLTTPSLVLLLCAGAGLPVSQAAKPFRPALVWEKSIAPGLVYRMEFDPNLPRTLHALRISPQSSGVHFSTELAGHTINEKGGVKGRWTPSQIVSQAGALAAVNGDFFSYDHGAPIGEMVRAGELITTPVRARAAFAWGPKDACVTVANAKAWVSIQDSSGATEERKLDSVNQPVGANGLALFTPAEGEVAPPAANVTAVLTAPEGSFSPNGTSALTVESIVSDQTPVTVPAGHAFLIGTGSRSAPVSALRAGDVVRIRTSSEGIDWEKFENLISGGPFLVRDGSIAVDADEEGFNADFQGRHPRTAIGKTADGDVWIVTVDGRQACSTGASLVELAGIMHRLGCTDAINLDGGGSTALNLLGLTVSRPSDGVERPVASAVVVFGPRPTEVTGAMQLRVSAKPSSSGGFQATVYRNGSPVPNIEVIWSARGAAWIDEGGLLHVVHSGQVKIGARALGQILSADVTVPGPEADRRTLSPADR
jgi:hypothetical protein